MNNGVWLAGLLVLAPTPVFGCVEFSIVGNAVNLPYNPFDPGNFADSFVMSVKPDAGSTATGVRFILIDTTPRGSDPQLGEDGPSVYDITWQPDRARKVFTLGADNINDLNGAFVELNGRRSVQTNFTMVIPRGQTALAGRHAEDLAVRYQCYNGRDTVGTETEQPRSNRTEYAVRVPRIVTARLAGGLRAGNIDFGDINATSLLERSVMISAQSTLPYRVKIESERGGALRRDGGGGRIGYVMQLAGLTVSDGSVVNCPLTPAPSGFSAPLSVRLSQPDVKSQPAGVYRDTITLTFKPDDGYSGNGCSTQAEGQ